MAEPPVQIETDRCLLIFDSHEDVAWIESILKRERGNFDHLLLGGDYFDASAAPPGGGIPRMCAKLQDLRREFGATATMLLGNHDISHLAARKGALTGAEPSPGPYPNSGFRPENARLIAHLTDEEWWKQCRLFQEVNGWLFSHAGLDLEFWPARSTVAESLAELDRQAKLALADLETIHPLLGCGPARGGDQRVSGLTWLDFSAEFRDALPLPQIVGHTASPTGARRNGRSWCLDGAQTCYGILKRGGGLEVKTP